MSLRPLRLYSCVFRNPLTVCFCVKEPPGCKPMCLGSLCFLCFQEPPFFIIMCLLVFKLYSCGEGTPDYSLTCAETPKLLTCSSRIALIVLLFFHKALRLYYCLTRNPLTIFWMVHEPSDYNVGFPGNKRLYSSLSMNHGCITLCPGTT